MCFIIIKQLPMTVQKRGILLLDNTYKYVSNDQFCRKGEYKQKMQGRKCSSHLPEVVWSEGVAWNGGGATVNNHQKIQPLIETISLMAGRVPLPKPRVAVVAVAQWRPSCSCTQHYQAPILLPGVREHIHQFCSSIMSAFTGDLLKFLELASQTCFWDKHESIWLSKTLEAHGCKPWVTNLSIVPHTLSMLTANITYCIILLEYVHKSWVNTHLV